MSMLTRKREGYAPGTMDAVYLRQDMDALDAVLRSGQMALDQLLAASAEFETEARRLGLPDLLARVLIQRSDIHSAGQRYPQAIVALQGAEQELGDLRQYDLKVKIYARLAKAQAQLQTWDAVLQTCRTGIELVEENRYNVSGQYLQSAYLSSRIGLYTWGVQAAYERGAHGLMLEWAELSKCRSVLRQRHRSAAPSVEEAQTEQQFRRVSAQIDAARAAGKGAALEMLLKKRRALWDLLLIQRAQARSEETLPDFSLEAVQAALKPDEAILYYYWLDPRTLLIAVIDDTGLACELRPVALEERQDLERFTQGILHDITLDTPVTYVDEARNFASLLLPPALTNRLQKKDRLLISPHRLLHALPFQALPWDGQHRYLIQRFAVTYTPNLTSLLLPYAAPREPRLLTLGVEAYQVKVDGEPLQPLKEAPLEVEALRRLYGENGFEVEAFSNSEVHEARLRRLEESGELGRFTTLHLATHGFNVSSDTPMESSLCLYDSILDGLEIANWRLEAELVVLSACSSGQRAIAGRGLAELPGDDLFGLQAAFFAAGAKRVLGALWPVRSDVAYEIMINFHRLLLAGRPPEVALQRAIVDYIEGAKLPLRKSFWWAPFFLSAVGRSARL